MVAENALNDKRMGKILSTGVTRPFLCYCFSCTAMTTVAAMCDSSIRVSLPAAQSQIEVMFLSIVLNLYADTYT